MNERPDFMLPQLADSRGIMEPELTELMTAQQQKRGRAQESQHAHLQGVLRRGGKQFSERPSSTIQLGGLLIPPGQNPPRDRRETCGHMADIREKSRHPMQPEIGLNGGLLPATARAPSGLADLLNTGGDLFLWPVSVFRLRPCWRRNWFSSSTGRLVSSILWR